MKIAITTDHGGFEAMQELKGYLMTLGHEWVDYGPQSLDMDDDYPDLIFPAAEAVARGDCELGIIMGVSGNGEAMAANRVKGVRCALFYGPVTAKNKTGADPASGDPYEIVRLSREHNNANMLSLSGRFCTLAEMKMAIEIWLNTPFSQAERHARRVHKLDERG
jgi:ribose 5-phosphate isomerase B